MTDTDLANARVRHLLAKGETMIADKVVINMDFTEHALTQAASKLGVELHSTTVWVAEARRVEARKMQAIYGFTLILVPSQLMSGDEYAWLCRAEGGNTIWSPGA